MAKKEYYLIVDFNTYAGNYIDSLGTWLTGYEPEYLFGSEEAAEFKNSFPGFDFHDVIELTTTEYGERAFDFHDESSSKLAMQFYGKPSQDLLAFLLERIDSFHSKFGNGLKLRSYLLIKNIDEELIELRLPSQIGKLD